MRDIINASMESLLRLNAPEYVEMSRLGHEMKDALVPGLSVMAKDNDNSPHLALTQALFESGYLSKTQRCFNLDMLWATIYGAKMHTAMDTFLNFFDWLIKNGHAGTERKSMFNPSGDNYYSAFQFQLRPDESDLAVRKLNKELMGKETDEVEDSFRTDVYRKVIYIENQSPAYAVVLDYSIFCNHPTHMHYVRLKRNYNDPCHLNELVSIEFDVTGKQASNKYSSYHTDKVCRIISTLNVDSMECKPVIEPVVIDSIMDNIYCGSNEARSFKS